MLVSGFFCILVAILLLLNFWQLKQHEPLESKTLEALVERLAADPGNEEIMKEIREFDLLVRKAYFTGSWQVKTGTWLMLFGGIIFVMALRVHTGLQKRIELPEGPVEKGIHAKWVTHRWLLAAGFLVMAFALAAAFLSHDYLDEYDPSLAGYGTTGDEKEEVPVIRIVDSTPENSGIPDTPVIIQEEIQTPEENVPEKGKTVAGEKTPPSEYYGEEDFKRNQNTFRGMYGHGISYHRNIPTQWDGASGKNVKWKVVPSKPGYNSPVIWDDMIFIAGADQQTRIVACYNRHTGRLLWEKKADGIPGSPAVPPRVTEDTGLSAPTMAVDGLRIYAIFATGDLIAFDLEGNRVWARNLGVPVNHYGHSSSLMIWTNKLLVQYDTGKGGRMLAVNTATGETVWDIRRDNQIAWSSPILISVDGKMQIVTSTDPFVAGYDPENGAELWKANVMMGEVGASPAYFGGLVFANNEYANLVALKPRPGAEIVWENDEYLSEASSPVASDGLLYLATSYGVLVCYDALTGEKYWEKDFGSGFYSSPMIAENKLYLIDLDGMAHILKADRTGTLISEPQLGEQVFALPAFADGRIYIKGKESLYCIEEKQE